MTRFSDEQLEEAYRELFRDMPQNPSTDPIGAEELEEAHSALFAAPDPYRRGGPFSARSREETIREQNARPVDDATIAEAADSMFC